MSVVDNKAATELANKHWQSLHYSGHGWRWWTFKKALLEAVELGRALERNRIIEAIKADDEQQPAKDTAA